MRTDPAVFSTKNLASAKSPRFVIKIEFSAYSIYVSSHSDISGVAATHIAGCLIEPSISSQKLNPDQGRAEIGAASFIVADRNTEFSDNVRALHAAGEGLRDKWCKFYLGFEGLAFSDFQLVGTQQIKDASYDKGAYRISCNDIQRAARKDIFNLVTTNIAQTVEPADTTITVASTTGFNTVTHGTSYSDAASSTVGYVKIKDEVIRYTGKTGSTFTGCTRGVLGTQAGRYVADGSTPASRREKVAEYVYLEMPGPKLAYALLTGVLHNDSASLPATWHLGISTSLVKLADFTGLGNDFWNPSDDTAGVVLRFEGLAKTDGKAFIETEIARLLGLFLPVYTTGELGLRRMTRVLADASGVATLDERNSISVGDLEHDFDALRNSFEVQWNWNGKEFSRTTTYLDAGSVAKHGRAPTMELKAKGLYGGRHTDSMLYKLLDSIRDRYSAPPVRLTVELLPSLNVIEIGDVVRVNHASLRDFTGTGDVIDRAFEVQSMTVNHRTGVVSLGLFGSTERASITSPTTPTSSLPDAFYTAQGTNLTAVMTITGGVVSGGPYTLAGTTDLTAAASTWYYSGDLTIPDGVTVNVTGNVQLRVKGYLTINGAINGVGGGLAGVADNGTATVIAGNSGWVGNSRGSDGIKRVNFDGGTVRMRSNPCAVTVAKNAAFPYLSLEVSGSTLKGIPTDLRGTGGGPGGKYVHESGTFFANGGTGAAGGAGLCTVSRGLGLGANASILLSGAASTAPAYYSTTNDDGKPVYIYPGTGGAGGPGSFLILLDGALLSAPDPAGRYVSKAGKVNLPAYKTAMQSAGDIEYHGWSSSPFAGWVENPAMISELDMSYSSSRIQYIPAPETATADIETLPPVAGLTTASGSSGYTVSFTPAEGTPQGTVFEVWEYTSSTPFSSATKRAEGAATAFFLSRANTNTVYVWVRARFKNSIGVTLYSTTTPASTGLAASSIANAGTYATASPTSIAYSAASSSLTTGSTTVSLVGSTPTTYSWAKVSGDTFTITSPTAATTTFSITSVGVGVTKSAVYRCTVNSAYTVDVSVAATNSGAALSVSTTPTTISAGGTGTTVTTGTVTATAAGGSGGYTYAWTKVTGGAITATSASSAATTFSAATLSAGESRTATFRVTATDSASATATADVLVTITRVNVTVTFSPTSISKLSSLANFSSSSCTATGAGGTAPYTYAWVKTSGDAITVNSPSSATTTFSVTGMVAEETRSATFTCTATDSGGATGSATLSVNMTRTP